LNWNQELDKSQYPMDVSFNPFGGYAPFEAMSDEQKLTF
jgi:hypothetical protein